MNWKLRKCVKIDNDYLPAYSFRPYGEVDYWKLIFTFKWRLRTVIF